jgi:RimJ/RimL family protein N-acetyltransferase
MGVVGLVGERVRLVPPEAALHLENALRWFNDPAVTTTLDFFLGVSRKQEEEFFARIESSRETDLSWAIVTLDDERHIGFIGLHQIDWKSRCAVGGIVLGEPDAWGRGYATDAVRIRLRFAFEQMGLHRIEGRTINPAMRRVYEKCGYRHEGVARKKLWRGGRWRDVDLFAILDEDFAPATPEG